MWFVFYWQFFKKASINVDNQHQSDKISNPSKSLPAGRQEPRSVLINALMVSLPVAYLVQGIVLFDVSPIYFNIFLFLAFAAYKFSPYGESPAGGQNLNQTKKIN